MPLVTGSKGPAVITLDREGDGWERESEESGRGRWREGERERGCEGERERGREGDRERGRESAHAHARERERQ